MVSRLTPEYSAPSATVNQVFMVPPRAPALRAGLNCCGMCYALERVGQAGRRAFSIARMRASCRHRAVGSDCSARCWRRFGNRLLTQHERSGDSALGREPANAAVGERCVTQTGVPRDRRSFVLKFCVRGRAIRIDYRDGTSAIRPIEDLGRRSETRHALRTYAIRRGAVFGTYDSLTT